MQAFFFFIFAGVSLKYIQNYLERTHQKPAYGAERAIFMVALLLAYKFVEDCGTLDAVCISYLERKKRHDVYAVIMSILDPVGEGVDDTDADACET